MGRAKKNEVGPKGTDLAARVEGSGLIKPNAHPEFEQPTLLDRAVGAVKGLIGNSAMDRHNARAAAFAAGEKASPPAPPTMTNAERRKMNAQMDSLTAREKRKRP